MEKRPYDIGSERAEPLKPVVAHIPEPPSTRNRINLKLAAPLEKILQNAAVNRATEILIEREAGKTRIRERIRGVLITDLRASFSSGEISEIFEFVVKSIELRKDEDIVWGEMTFDAMLASEAVSCRLIYSESNKFSIITIRLFKIADKPFDPTSWGMGPAQAQVLENFMQRSHGVIIFCGTDADEVPPHIQACARFVGTPERHVIAVSAHTEVWFTGIEQLVSGGDREKFSKMLKVAFRHEPDLVVVNPVEKKEHLEICFSEALRGRMVFVRAYAQDASDALLQVLNMGIEPYVVGSALLGIVAQRTLRLNCPKCQDKDTITRDRLKDLGIPLGMQPSAFFRGKGCDACFKTGFDRETNIFEVLEMSDDLRNRLGKDMKSESLRSMMKNAGLMTLRQVAIHKAINGQTSLSEVLRVTP